MAARGVGLWPQGLVYPDASSYRSWNSGAATGQCKCLRPAAEGTHNVNTCIDVLSTHMSAGNAPSVSPTTGRTWAMELQYLQLSRAVKYG